MRLAQFDESQHASLKQEFKTKFNQPEENLSNIAIVFQELLSQFLVESIAFINHNCKKYQPVVDSNLFNALFKLLNTFIAELKPNEFGIIESYMIDTFWNYIEPIFFFCLTWSVGAVLGDQESRNLYDKWLR